MATTTYIYTIQYVIIKRLLGYRVHYTDITQRGVIISELIINGESCSIVYMYKYTCIVHVCTLL